MKVQRLPSLIGKIVSAIFIALLADIIAAQFGHPLSFVFFCLILVFTFVFSLYLQFKFPSFYSSCLKVFRFLLPAVILISAACYIFFFIHSKYQDVDNGKSSLFAEKQVMIIVPHEDDDLNIAGGLMEEYLKYGSDVRVVFVTNGDYTGMSAVRLQEAIDVMSAIGIPEENIVFLGYGDGWNGPHIYNSASEERKAAISGKMETYGLENHPAYVENHPYTRSNLCADLKNCILDYSPDILICSDYDSHNDHQAVSMFFEEAMGQILKEQPDYSPVVLKAFAYSTAYYAPDDFYSDNILSTKDPYTEFQKQDFNVGVYEWSARTRLPVNAGTLSHSLLNASGYTDAKKYASQDADLHAVRVINGDKVFWERRTDSLLYGAVVTASSGDASKLNDFKLLDNNDLYGAGTLCDGTWVPDSNDTLPEISIVFQDETPVSVLCLYDNPSEEDNILNVHISADSGLELDTGPLNESGACTEFNFPMQNIKKITLTITAAEGSNTGLTEIEAFKGSSNSSIRFIKFQDNGGNFLYNYMVPAGGNGEISLFSAGASDNLEDYAISCSSPEALSIDGETIKVTCPPGKTLELSAVSNADENISDTISIFNPGLFYRFGMKLEAIFHNIIRYSYKQMICYRMAKAILA